jgi:hypothetical protein
LNLSPIQHDAAAVSWKGNVDQDVEQRALSVGVRPRDAKDLIAAREKLTSSTARKPPNDFVRLSAIRDLSNAKAERRARLGARRAS